MASGQSVWGIEIGQTALKAFRCNLTATGHRQRVRLHRVPEDSEPARGGPEELVGEAIEQFLERNESASAKRFASAFPARAVWRSFSSRRRWK